MTTNKHDFRVGDVVSITGTVLQAHDDVLDIEGTNKLECVWVSNAVLVERPEPKISMELTRRQWENLAHLASAYGLGGATTQAADLIRETLDALD